MRALKGKEDNDSKKEFEAVVKAIADIEETNFNKVKKTSR